MSYIGAGVFAACLFKAGIPALNIFGMTYIAISWPVMVYCARLEDNCSGMPPDSMMEYMYTFD